MHADMLGNASFYDEKDEISKLMIQHHHIYTTLEPTPHFPKGWSLGASHLLPVPKVAQDCIDQYYVFQLLPWALEAGHINVKDIIKQNMKGIVEYNKIISPTFDKEQEKASNFPSAPR